jgi:hypothetical protein
LVLIMRGGRLAALVARGGWHYSPPRPPAVRFLRAPWSAAAAATSLPLPALGGPGAPPQNGGVQVYIEDNGLPVNGVPVNLDAAAGVCTDPTLNPAWNRIESGDYVIRDAG